MGRESVFERGSLAHHQLETLDQAMVPKVLKYVAYPKYTLMVPHWVLDAVVVVLLQ